MWKRWPTYFHMEMYCAARYADRKQPEKSVLKLEAFGSCGFESRRECLLTSCFSLQNRTDSQTTELAKEISNKHVGKRTPGW